MHHSRPQGSQNLPADSTIIANYGNVYLSPGGRTNLTIPLRFFSRRVGKDYTHVTHATARQAK